MPARRLAEVEHAVAHHDRVVSRSRWIGIFGLFGATALLLLSCHTVARLIADYGSTMSVPRAQFVPGMTATLVVVGLSLAMGLGASALRHFEGETPFSVAARVWADPIVSFGSLTEATSALSVVLFVPFVFAYLASLMSMRRLKATRADLLAAAELLHRSRDPGELARLSARGGASLTGGWKLIEAMGFERIHASRRTGPGLGSAGGSAGASARLGSGVVAGAVAPITGLLECWESRDWAEGEHFHLASRSGSVLVHARETLTYFDAEGSRVWAKTFPSGQHVSAAALAPDGRRIAVVTARPELWVLTADTGHALTTRPVPNTTSSVAITDGAERVFVGDKLGNVRSFDRQLHSLDVVRLSHPVELLSVACETERAVAASHRGVASVFRIDGSAVRKLTLRSEIRRVWMEEDGERALLLTGADGLMAYDLDRGHVATYALSRPVIDGDSDAPGGRILLLTLDGRLVMLDAAARILWQGEASPGTVGVRFEQEGEFVWTWAKTGALRRMSVTRASGARAAESAPQDRRPAPVSDPAPLDLEQEREVPVRSARTATLPLPGGYRSLGVDPETGFAALVHPNGVVVMLDAALRERSRHRLAEGTGQALFAERGGLCVVGSDERVVLLDSRASDASLESVMLRAPSFTRVADGTALVVGTANGEIAYATVSSGLEMLRTGGARIANLVARELTEGPLIAAALGNGKVTVLDRHGEEHFRLDPSSDGTAKLAFGAVGLLVAEADGRLRVHGPDGSELATRQLPLPVIAAELLGPHFLVTDKLGNLHRFEPDLASAGTRPPPSGLTCLGLSPEGEPWIAHVHRHLLTVETWRGELRGRWEAPGTPLDLEPTARGSWLLLTPGGLLGPEIPDAPPDPKQTAAGHLEL